MAPPLTNPHSFLIAGHETTSVAATWCLFALTQAPEVQKKLREELWTLETDTPTMDELSSLPYLDAVVRETLRIHAPVPSTIRISMKDDVIPVGEPYVDRHGQVQDSIRCVSSFPYAVLCLVFLALSYEFGRGRLDEIGLMVDHASGTRS